MTLLVGGLAWLGGVGLVLLRVGAGTAPAGMPLAWALRALPLAGAAALARAIPLRLIALAGALLLLGGARGLAALGALDDDPLRTYFGPAALRGVVAEPAAAGEASLSLRLRVAAVEREGAWVPASGIVLVRLPRTAAYDYGDRPELRGRL